MKVLVVATEAQKSEIDAGIKAAGAEIYFVPSFENALNFEDFDGYFLLANELSEIDFQSFSGKPVAINSVIETLNVLALPPNFFRVNGWPGFLQRHVYEAAGQNKQEAAALIQTIGREVLFVKDEPGLMAARVISMIINEAYFGLEEKLSTIDEINLAMKLGTNYPMGPFEWEAKIGTANIYRLLQKLSETDKRYLPAPALIDKIRSAAAS